MIKCYYEQCSLDNSNKRIFNRQTHYKNMHAQTQGSVWQAAQRILRCYICTCCPKAALLYPMSRGWQERVNIVPAPYKENIKHTLDLCVCVYLCSWETKTVNTHLDLTFTWGGHAKCWFYRPNTHKHTDTEANCVRSVATYIQYIYLCKMIITKHAALQGCYYIRGRGDETDLLFLHQQTKEGQNILKQWIRTVRCKQTSQIHKQTHTERDKKVRGEESVRK